MLDEECKLPKGTDDALLQRIVKAHQRNPHFQKAAQEIDTFRIGHFAGQVQYHITGFVEKNRDTLQVDLITAMKTSNLPPIKDTFVALPEEEKPEEPAVTRASNNLSPRLRTPTTRTPSQRGSVSAVNSKVTLVHNFKLDLGALVELLSSSSRHYVRCIKPNDLKQCEMFDAFKVLTKLSCNGVLETVTLRTQGF
eukprot:TRINITY_DN25558_c0_g1_i1.p1 TRINITY_DN25558_c0_g1~~TRINITY_DN25558_c0_g1_i1.p1  ORF type:complete len:222 (-),score=51.03 TRINITY_DN25558_c0_g1_i1:111-695(-)